MSKKKKKYYVIWEGSKTGILESWDECKKSIHGFKGAKYKSFSSLELAKKAFSDNYEKYKGKVFFKSDLSKEQLELIGKPKLDTVSVDAACSGNPGILEYQCVDTKTKKLIFHYGPLFESTNNIGEFLGLVHAISLMTKNNDNRPIYTDSKTAISWVKRKSYRTNLEKTEKNTKSFELLDRAVEWLKTNDFTNPILKWETKAWGEIPADFDRK
jgi:ribonuclease HI